MTSGLRVLLTVYLMIHIAACNNPDVPVGKMPATLSTGKEVPDFTYRLISDTTNTPEKFSALRGKVIYLDFWASWCKPCLKSMPLLNELRNELLAENFEVIAVNLDYDIANGEAFLREHPVDYPVIRAEDNRIETLYQIKGLPTAYLIDKQGVLRYVHQGFKEKDIDEIKKQILSILKERG